MSYYIYILKSEHSGKHYIGSTNNLADRLKRYNEGRSKYTKHEMPWELKHYSVKPERHHQHQSDAYEPSTWGGRILSAKIKEAKHSLKNVRPN